MIVTLDAVKAWLRITVDTYDDDLTALILRTDAVIETATRVYFGLPRAVTDYVDGTGLDRMVLNRFPYEGDSGDVDALTLQCRTSGYGSDVVWEDVEATEFERDGRVLFTDGYWTRGRRNYLGSYSEGFDEAPGDIQALALELISGVWRRIGTEGLKSERIGDYAYTRADIEDSKRWATTVSSWVKKRVI